jgi:hypothetical protein
VNVARTAGTVVDVAARSSYSCLHTQGFILRPRLGAGFLAQSSVGTGVGVGSLDVGVGLGYLLDPRIGLELRGDFQIPFTGEAVRELDSVWLSLNLIWNIVAGYIVQPYLVVGVDLAIIRSDPELNLEPMVAGGGQAGLGLEIVVGRVLGISLEVLGVISGYEGEVLEGGVNVTASVALYI